MESVHEQFLSPILDLLPQDSEDVIGIVDPEVTYHKLHELDFWSHDADTLVLKTDALYARLMTYDITLTDGTSRKVFAKPAVYLETKDDCHKLTIGYLCEISEHYESAYFDNYDNIIFVIGLKSSDPDEVPNIAGYIEKVLGDISVQELIDTYVKWDNFIEYKDTVVASSHDDILTIEVKTIEFGDAKAE